MVDRVPGVVREAAAVVRGMADGWRTHRVSSLAAEVAFFWLLGLFPALLAMAAALGLLEALVGSEVAMRAQDEVVGFLENVLTDEASGTIEAVRSLFLEASPGALSIGALAALWAASRGFVAMIRALNVAYDIEQRHGYLRLRASALVLAVGSLVVAAIVLAMLVLGPLLGTGREVADALGLGRAFATFWDWLRWPSVVAIVVAWAATIYHVAANRQTPWRWDLPGALLAAAIWALVSVGLRLYLSFAGSTNQVLGVLGGSLIITLWLYLLGLGLMVGGELNAVVARRNGVGRQEGREHNGFGRQEGRERSRVARLLRW